MANLLTIGQRVYHDFSGIHGTVLAYRSDPQGYNYQVKWQDGKSTTDWYKRKVLKLI